MEATLKQPFNAAQLELLGMISGATEKVKIIKINKGKGIVTIYKSSQNGEQTNSISDIFEQSIHKIEFENVN